MSSDNREAETYVGLADPALVRRPMLEAAKASVSSQRTFNRLRGIQEQKLVVRGELAKILKELRDEMAKLQMILPPRDVKDTPLSLPTGKKKVLDHRIDSIERALAEIEDRLKGL